MFYQFSIPARPGSSRLTGPSLKYKALTFAHPKQLPMFRTHDCGTLRLADAGKNVTLAGWVQAGREILVALTFVDLRDRYGITQVVFDQDDNAPLADRARKLGREFVVQITGTVRERTNKNPQSEDGATSRSSPAN